MKQVDIAFSIPVFLTYLIQLMYHTTDTLIVGRFLGSGPRVALVAVYPVTWFAAAVSMAVLYIAKTKRLKKGEDSYETQIA